MNAILSWLAAWWPTVLICMALIALVALLIYGLIRDKKKGSSCCGGCGHCPMSGQCHRVSPSKKDLP